MRDRFTDPRWRGVPRPDFDSGWVEAGRGEAPREWIAAEAAKGGDSFLMSDRDGGVLEVWSRGQVVGLYSGMLFAQRCYDRVHRHGHESLLDGVEYHVVGADHEDTARVVTELRDRRARAILRHLHDVEASRPWEVWLHGESVGSWGSVEEAKLVLARRLHRPPDEDAFKDNNAELLARFGRRVDAITRTTTDWVLLFDNVEVRRSGRGYGVRHERLHPAEDWSPDLQSCASSAWWYAFQDHAGAWQTIHDVLDLTWEW